jgi:short-subunit dehydrogenase
MPNALVTGGSSGIGRELAARLARDGYQLVLVARNAERLTATADELSRTWGIGATTLPLDLADPAAPAKLIAELERLGLAVDLLVNNAGTGSYGRFAHSDLDRELAMIRLNVEALVALTRLLLPGMLDRGRGRIANLASTAAFQPGPGMAVYYASKAFVLSFSEALACELAGTGVTVTAVCPGPTPTGFQDAAGTGPARRARTAVAMPVGRVADIAYRGIMKGKRVVIPGFGNRVMALAARLGPRRAATAAVGWVNAGGRQAGRS